MAYSGYSSWAGNWQVLRGRHVKGISASILQQWKQALLHLFNIICFSLFEQSRVDSLYKDRWDVEDDSAGSRSSGEVRLKAKCWLTASSRCTLTQASCGEHLPPSTQILCTATVDLSITHGQAVTDVLPVVVTTSEDTCTYKLTHLHLHVSLGKGIWSYIYF